jgi:hypothetical protein
MARERYCQIDLNSQEAPGCSHPAPSSTQAARLSRATFRCARSLAPKYLAGVPQHSGLVVICAPATRRAEAPPGTVHCRGTTWALEPRSTRTRVPNGAVTSRRRAHRPAWCSKASTPILIGLPGRSFLSWSSAASASRARITGEPSFPSRSLPSPAKASTRVTWSPPSGRSKSILTQRSRY